MTVYGCCGGYSRGLLWFLVKWLPIILQLILHQLHTNAFNNNHNGVVCIAARMLD